MLTFFRRMRKRILGDGTTSKYLLYAIGEIALVVIGILIALQINNWNQAQKAAKFEYKLLVELRNTIVDDFELMQMSIDGNKRAGHSCEIILAHFDQGLPYHDSLSLHFENTNHWWTMLIRTNAYDNAKAYGLDFIKNDSTRSMLSGLYEQNQKFAEVMDERQSLYHFNTVTPVLIELFESIEKTWFLPQRGNVPNDYEALKRNKTYRAILNTNIGNRRYFNEWVIMSLDQMKALEKKLQLEIENH